MAVYLITDCRRNYTRRLIRNRPEKDKDRPHRWEVSSDIMILRPCTDERESIASPLKYHTVSSARVLIVEEQERKPKVNRINTGQLCAEMGRLFLVSVRLSLIPVERCGMQQI